MHVVTHNRQGKKLGHVATQCFGSNLSDFKFILVFATLSALIVMIASYDHMASARDFANKTCLVLNCINNNLAVIHDGQETQILRVGQCEANKVVSCYSTVTKDMLKNNVSFADRIVRVSIVIAGFNILLLVLCFRMAQSQPVLVQK